MSQTIRLPWPDRTLHPNSRCHWAKKAKAAKSAREDAAWWAKAAGVKKLDADAVKVTFTFVPPDARRRDTDGMLSACKSAIDGIADVLGVDDSKWAILVQREPPKHPGEVRIEIGSVS